MTLEPSVGASGASGACWVPEARRRISVRSWSANSQLVVRPVADAPILQANLVHMRFEPLSQLTLAFIAELQQLVQQQGFGMPVQRPPLALAA